MKKTKSTKRQALARGIPAIGIAAALGLVLTIPANASSHREAPAITEDPVADITDLYAFVSPDRADSTTLVMNVDPFQLPGGGPNFNKFGDDVLYEFNIDNNGDAVADVKYQFRFKTTYANPNTFLYNTNQVTSVNDPDLNRKQTYNITEVRGGKSTVIGTDLPTAPAYVGALRSTPNYAVTAAGANISLESGAVKSFAGPRDDPFSIRLGVSTTWPDLTSRRLCCKSQTLVSPTLGILSLGSGLQLRGARVTHKATAKALGSKLHA
jgi:hypothetical protein